MQIHEIRKVLIANRGEIALRIQRSCQDLGISTVSVCSEVDKQSLFARSAEELVVLGERAPADTYLNIEKLLDAAQKTGCDAVHPGYGFLSERADFARAVCAAGLVFIGPDAESIELLGSKTSARERVAQHGVPCTPGTAGGLSDAELQTLARDIGFPVLIKAVAGGGGRGMRVAHSESELRELLPRARGEAGKNFGSEDVYIEKYIVNPRHVEVQVFGDSQGNVIHLGTRDCSCQRRHQKLVEEAPAPFLEEALRERIHDAALAAARSVAYKNAGTVEFLVSGEDFYFLEMNTRIQVEHPVTEVVTGLDLIALQLDLAAGRSLPLTQQEVRFSGHAIEFRIYAENPSQNFQPSTGTVVMLEEPKEDFVRIDPAVAQGDSISPYYDATLCKLIVSGSSRGDAIRRSEKALAGYRVEGLETTRDFHRWLLRFSPFKDRPVDIAYVEREFSAESLRDVYASDVRDPRHRPPVDGIEELSFFSHASRAHGARYTIEVVHAEDGSFVATPIRTDGRRAKNLYCRRSNGLHAALRSVIDEVLEKGSPERVFGP